MRLVLVEDRLPVIGYTWPLRVSGIIFTKNAGRADLVSYSQSN
jgi:hypothetical protein